MDIHLATATAASSTAWRSRNVFLSDARLSTLKNRVQQEVEPTYTAFRKLKAEADSQVDRQPHVPSKWYVPGYYTDAAAHQKAKSDLADDANSAYTLALAYRMSGEQKYAQAATRLTVSEAPTHGQLLFTASHLYAR